MVSVQDIDVWMEEAEECSFLYTASLERTWAFLADFSVFLAGPQVAARARTLFKYANSDGDNASS